MVISQLLRINYGNIILTAYINIASKYFYATNTFSMFCPRRYNCGLDNGIAVVYHVWLAVELIVAADRHATIAFVCSLLGVTRKSAAVCAVV